VLTDSQRILRHQINHPDLITVTVTAEDIARGFPRDCGQCPINLALRRVMPRHVIWFAVADTTVQYEAYGVPLSAKLPPEATAFIHRFDAGLPVEPFVFSVGPGKCCFPVEPFVFSMEVA
jgi:hypothetical protein